MKKIKIALIGVGDISGIYLKNITHTFKEIELVGLCDLIPEKAQRGFSYIEQAITEGADTVKPVIYRDMYEAFNDPQVDVILNLTRPYEHYHVTKEALLHGKHVYSEKPLAVDMEEASELVHLAEEKGLLLGGAPDTFLGAGIQTARAIIDAGILGDIIGGSCAMVSHGPETWHPDPEFFYKRGGGPMLDMGPYYVTALLQLIGEAKGVMGMTRKSFPTRLITSQPHSGTVVNVETDTHLTGCIEFTNGAIVQLCTTFDVYGSQTRFELYGTKGSMVVPDPNTFNGPVLLYIPEDQAAAPTVDPALLRGNNRPDFYKDYKEIPIMFDYSENSRALGLADMCKALATGRNFRANYKQQQHLLEILTSFAKSCHEKRYIELKTKYERSAAMAHNPIHGILD